MAALHGGAVQVSLGGAAKARRCSVVLLAAPGRSRRLTVGARRMSCDSRESHVIVCICVYVLVLLAVDDNGCVFDDVGSEVGCESVGVEQT